MSQPNCHAISYIWAEPIERAVLATIFESLVDIPSFERAIAQSLPDNHMVKQLERSIERMKKSIKRVQSELDKLADAVLKGTLTHETIRSKEHDLLKLRAIYEEHLEADRMNLTSLPNADQNERKPRRYAQCYSSNSAVRGGWMK